MNVFEFGISTAFYIVSLIVAFILFFNLLPLIPHEVAWLAFVVLFSVIAFTFYKIYLLKKKWR